MSNQNRKSSLGDLKHPMEFLVKQSPALFLKPGDIVEGEILERRGPKLFIDLGAAGTGVVYVPELPDAESVSRSLRPGERLAAKVVNPDNEEGYIELSLREAGRERVWQELRRLAQEKSSLELEVRGANRGGLILEYRGIAGFLPASQLAPEHYPRVEGGDKEKIYEELKKLVGQTLAVTVLDFDPDEGKVIFSEKSRFAEDLRRELSKYRVGDTVEGTVSGVVSFGAFVRFGSVGVPPAAEGAAAHPLELEGLVHISEIDWQLIANPAEVLKVGDHLRAKIIGIEGDRVSLSLKALREDPWVAAAERLQKGGIVTGTVVKFNPFGAFVKVDDTIQGLAHISEFGSEAKMRELLAINADYPFRILALEPQDHRLSLGLIREDTARAADPAQASDPAEPEVMGRPDSVGEDPRPLEGR